MTPTASAEGERPVDLDGLEALAKAATPGPWENCHDGHSPENGKLGNWVETRAYNSLPDPEDSSCAIADCPNDSVLPDDNARFIAAANPSTVQALIQEARDYRRLTRALEFINDAALGCELRKAMWPDNECITSTPERMLELAMELGWTEDQGRTL